MGTPMVRVRVPASTANFGPGFDAFGMALSLYAWIEMEACDPDVSTFVEMIGSGMEGIPSDESNLIVQCAYAVYDRAGIARQPLYVKIYSEIPLTRGLGSSASAIIGGMTAANALLGEPLSKQEIFRMATEMEQHPDNVGAALFGGFIAASWDGTGSDPVYLNIPVPDQLQVLVAIPHFELSTEKARGALPPMYSRADAIYNLSRTALVVAAMAQSRLDLLADAMRDRIHQPYRSALVPGLQTILEGATQHGAIGAALSGAGPTILALVDRSKPDSGENLNSWIADTLRAEGIEATMMFLEVCCGGVQTDCFYDGAVPSPQTLAAFAAARNPAQEAMR